MRHYGQCKGRRWDTAQPIITRSNGRTCNRCGRSKPAAAFYTYIDRHGVKRLKGICKACLRESRL